MADALSNEQAKRGRQFRSVPVVIREPSVCTERRPRALLEKRRYIQRGEYVRCAEEVIAPGNDRANKPLLKASIAKLAQACALSGRRKAASARKVAADRHREFGPEVEATEQLHRAEHNKTSLSFI